MASDASEKAAPDWYVYLVRTRTNMLYCGITTDLDRRFRQHVTGQGAKALRGKGPLELAWSCAIGQSRSDASKVEYQIKRLHKEKKEQLTSGKLALSSIINMNAFD